MKFIKFILLFYFLFPHLSFAMRCSQKQNENISDFKKIWNTLSANGNDKFQCPSWILNRENLPLCPELKQNGKATLPETYPKAFIFLGTEIDNQYLFDLLKKAYLSNPDQVPVFVGGIYSANLEDVLKDLKKIDKKFPWEKHLVSVGMVYQDSSVYVRDVFSSMVDEKGEISTFRTRSQVDGTVNGVFTLMQKCGIKTFNPSDDLTEEEDDFSQYSLGGNFLTIVPGLNATSYLEPAHERAGWNETNTVIFEGNTNVGHIDEIAQTLKLNYDSMGCPKVSMLVASPSKTIELLEEQMKKNPDEYFLDWPWREKKDGSFTEMNRAEWSQRRSQVLDELNPNYKGIKEGVGVKELCHKLTSLPSTNEIDFNKNEHYSLEFTFGKARPRSRIIVLNSDNSQDSEKYKQTVITLNVGWTETQYQQAYDECKKHEVCKIVQTPINPINKACENMTVKDAYQIFTKTDFNAEKSKNLENEINKFKEGVEKKIQALYPKCSNSIDWIKSPVVYKDGYWALPNSTNSLPVDSKNVALPEPYSKVFKNYFEKELKERDLNISWIDTFGMNNQRSVGMKTGNIHCGSNSIPMCKPRKNEK
jgi:hypothetical protein